MYGSILQLIAVILLLISIWFIYENIKYYFTIIKRNPRSVMYTPVLTQTTSQKDKKRRARLEKLVAPYCSFRQYLRHLRLVFLPFMWSAPIKIAKEIYSRQFLSKLSEYEKRQRLAKIVLETSIVLGFDKKEDQNYVFKFRSLLMPCRDISAMDCYFVNECLINIAVNDDKVPVLIDIVVNGTHLQSINEMFSFLGLLLMYTHTLTHVQCANIAEANTNIIQHRADLSEGFKKSIDYMHAAISGLNEGAIHYPAYVLGISSKHLGNILGYNCVQQIDGHRNIVQCSKISEFVNFTMKARMVFAKYLGDTGISISTLAANTIFHSIDHYNMGKYFLHDSEEKVSHGISTSMTFSIFGGLNYDIGRWQRMKYNRSTEWKNIYSELKLINAELADNVDMFASA